MLLFSSAYHQLTFTKLKDCMQHLSTAAQWAEGEWGYIRNMGVAFRKDALASLKDNVYIGTLAEMPVAMFALLEHSFHEDIAGATHRLPHMYKLMYVYVAEDYRGFRFGKQIIQEAKRVAAAAGKDLILLDTLKPKLNSFYEQYGAEVISEGQLFSYPIEVLTMRVS
jgi:GNAT superfamily N-acetyltransferase